MRGVILAFLAAMFVGTAGVSAQDANDGDDAVKAADEALREQDADYRLEEGLQDMETHASDTTNIEMLQKARANKQSFIGKTLMLGEEMEVGPILDVRRWKRDQELYLVVDAKEYFNEDATFAVPVGDVDAMETVTVTVGEAPGSHLRGMEYVPDEYEAIDAGEQIPLIVDE